MKIGKEMSQALNNQIAIEVDAAQHYLATASWCEAAGYDGGASYFYEQSNEEKDHAMKLIKFLNSIGVTVTIPGASKPRATYKSLEDALKVALASEQEVTAAIHKIMAMAYKKAEYPTIDILEWFVHEQVEEETKFEAILQKFDTMGRDKLAVAEIDKILAEQTGQH